MWVRRRINIYETTIANYAPTVRLGTPANPTNDDVIDQTIGHEIGHGLAVNHPWHTPVPTGSNPPVDGGWFGFGGGLSHVRVPFSGPGFSGPGPAYDLLTQHINDNTTTNTYWNRNVNAAWTIPVGTYMRNLALKSHAASFTYTYGSTIMDYDMPFTQANRDGIYPATSFHNLHSWEYRLLGSGVSSQENPQWTPRPALTLCLPPSNTPGTTASLSPSNDTYTASAGGTHTSNFTSSSPYTSVAWYVKSPTDTSTRGTEVETDTGDGSATTASLDYTFAADAVAGVYVITAYVTTSSGVYEVSYTVTLSTVPGAPAIESVTLAGDTEVLVSWHAPTSDGGSPITDYEYRYQLSGAAASGSWTSAGSDLSESIRGLTPGSRWTVEVRAKNSVGYSVASASFSFTVPAIPPSFTPASGSSYAAIAGETHRGEVRNSSIYGAWLYVNGEKIKWGWGVKQRRVCL